MHEIRWNTYKENEYSPEDIQKKESDRARRDGSCLYNRIRFIYEPIMDSQEDARKYINDNDNLDYDQIAVRYRDVKESENVIRSREHVASCRRRLAQIDSQLYASSRNAEYISCKSCGSRLSRKHITSNKCPLCMADMRNKQQLGRVESQRKAVERAIRGMKQQMKKCADKATICWLVKTEIHV